MHLIDFFATRQILIPKSITAFFFFCGRMAGFRSGVFGVGGKSRDLRLDWKAQCIPSSSLLGAPKSALPPRAAASASQALLPSPAPLSPRQPPRPLLRACLPFPRLLWHPFLLFILPNWRPTPAAPQCAPHPVQQILRKARPALAQPPPPGGGRGRAGRRSRSPGAPRVSGADRAGWAGPPGGRRPAAAGGRGAGEGAVSGSRRRWRCPGARVPDSARPGRARANS